MAQRFGWQRGRGLVVAAMILAVSLPATANLEQHAGNGKLDWTAGTITVTGSGAAPERGSAAQKRLMAQRAAVVDGYRQLAEIIQGVHVDSETTVKDFVVESDVIKTQVNALVKGAKPGAPRYLSDGAVEVDVTCSLYGQSGLSGITTPAMYGDEADSALPGGIGQVAAWLPLNLRDLLAKTHAQYMPKRRHSRKPAPPVSAIKPAAVSNPYTSVIIDCAGLGGEPAMSPTILDGAKGELYFGNRPLTDEMTDFVINEGIVAYTHSMAEATANERAGRNPLKLRATRVDGRFKADAVLKESDAQLLAGAEAGTHILSNAKVVFIL